MPFKNARIFVSYSQKDQKWYERFRVHLQGVERSLGGKLLVWSDKDIAPGRNWEEEIDRALSEANLALLLVSPNFLASSFIQSKELPTVLQKKERLRVLWVPVSEAVWQATGLKEVQATHPPESPLDRMSPEDQEQAIVAICLKILEVIHQEDPPVLPPSPFIPLRYEPTFLRIDRPTEPLVITHKLLAYSGLDDPLRPLPGRVDIVVCLPYQTQAFSHDNIQTVLVCSTDIGRIREGLGRKLSAEDLGRLSKFAPANIHPAAKERILKVLPEALKDCLVLAVAIPPTFIGKAHTREWIEASYETILRVLLASVLGAHSRRGFREFNVHLISVGDMTAHLSSVCRKLVEAMELTAVAEEVDATFIETVKLVHWTAHRMMNAGESRWLEILRHGFRGAKRDRTSH